MARMLGAVSNWSECACRYCGPHKARTMARFRDKLRRAHRSRERTFWQREVRDG